MKFSLASSWKLYKAAYSNHPKEIWAIAILTLINRMGTMVIPFLSVYLTTVLDFSLKDAGLLTTAFGLGSFLGSYAGGKLTDKYGANKIIIFSLLFSGLMFISLQWATDFYTLFLLIFITSSFADAYRPAATATVGDYVPKSETGRTMAFFRLAINVGMAISPLIGGIIAVAYGYKWLFWIDGITCILAAIYFSIISRNWKKLEQKKPETTKTTHHEIKKTKSLRPFQNKTYLTFLLTTYLIGFCFIQWFHTIPVFIKTVWLFDERFIGVLMGISCTIIVLVEMPLIDWIEKTKQIRKATMIGGILIGLSVFTFFFTGEAFSKNEIIAIGIIGVVILSFGEILYLPFNNSIPIYMSPTELKGEYMAWYWMTWSLTTITGPLIGFNVIDEFGYSIFWTLLIIMIGTSVFISQFLGDKVLNKEKD